MYCNICSKIVRKNHFKTKTHKKGEKTVIDVLLDVVGGEMGLVKQILDNKRDMEYQEKTIKLDRLSTFEKFKDIKEMTLVNTFDKKLKIIFKKNHCFLDLDEPISLYKLTPNQESFLETFDLALMKFINRGPQTNKRLEQCIKRQVASWNICQFDAAEYTLLMSRHKELEF